MAEMLIFAGQALKQELEKDPAPAQLQRAERILKGSRVALQYAEDVRTLENRRTMPVTNSRAGANTIGYNPRDRAASKV